MSWRDDKTFWREVAAAVDDGTPPLMTKKYWKARQE
jgi:hypothetical protein